MNFRYTPLQKVFKRTYRAFFPVPYTQLTDLTLKEGNVGDICKISGIPKEKLRQFFLRAIKKLQEVKGGDIGNYLEFGVFNGSSLAVMYKVAKETELKSMKFFGFDAFEGLPADSENEDDGVWKEGFYSCSFEKMKECLRGWGINPDEITWVKGWYKNTLNSSTASKYSISKPGIVFIDCDTYSSSKTVLDFIGQLLTEPAILCFDDWKLFDLDIKGMGEYKAFNEFLEQSTHLEAEEIKSYNRKSRSFLIRLKN